MLQTNTKDFALTTSGDLSIGPDGDFATITDIAVMQQEIAFRLKTRLGDYFYAPLCGSKLESLIGYPNSSATAELGESLIREALTHGNYLLSGTIDIISYPTDDGTGIVFNILVDLSTYGFSTEEFISFPLTIDLKEGLIF